MRAGPVSPTAPASRPGRDTGDERESPLPKPDPGGVSDSPLPTPTATPIVLEVLHVSTYADGLGDLRFQGELRNPGRVAVVPGIEHVFLLSAGGTKLRDTTGDDFASVHVAAPVLNPGELSPFLGVFGQPVPAWSRLEIETLAVPITQTPTAGALPLKIEILEQTGQALDAGGYEVRGMLMNADDRDCTDCHLWLTLYGPEGSVVAVAQDLLPDLPVGGRVAVQVGVREMAGTAVGYRLLVFGRTE